MNSKFKDENNLIITCPVCGYSFKPDFKRPKTQSVCPMCGFKFKSMKLNLNKPNKRSGNQIF